MTLIFFKEGEYYIINKRVRDFLSIDVNGDFVYAEYPRYLQLRTENDVFSFLFATSIKDIEKHKHYYLWEYFYTPNQERKAKIINIEK